MPDEDTACGIDFIEEYIKIFILSQEDVEVLKKMKVENKDSNQPLRLIRKMTQLAFMSTIKANFHTGKHN